MLRHGLIAPVVTAVVAAIILVWLTIDMIRLLHIRNARGYFRLQEIRTYLIDCMVFSAMVIVLYTTILFLYE